MTSKRWQRRVSPLLHLLRIYTSPSFGSIHHVPSHLQTKNKEDHDKLTHAKKTLENSVTLAASKHRQKIRYAWLRSLPTGTHACTLVACVARDRESWMILKILWRSHQVVVIRRSTPWRHNHATQWRIQVLRIRWRGSRMSEQSAPVIILQIYSSKSVTPRLPTRWYTHLYKSRKYSVVTMQEKHSHNYGIAIKWMIYCYCFHASVFSPYGCGNNF